MKLEIHNFLCYKDISIDFSNLDKTKPILVMSNNPTKSNGVGKSALFQALLWLFWGQIPRLKNTKIKNIELKDDNTTRVKLDTDRYTFIRIRSTDKGHLQSTLDVIDKAEGKEYHFDTLSNSVEYIKHFFGDIDFDIFTFLYYFDSYSFVPFFGLSNGKKKELLENLFKIDIFQELLDRVKGIHNDVHTTISELQSEANYISQQIDLNRKQATFLQNQLDSNLSSKLTKLQEEIKDIENKLSNYPSDLEKITQSKKEQAMQLKFEYNNLQSELKKLPTIGEPCPVCGTIISNQSHIAKHKQEIENKIQTIKTKYNKIANEYKSLNTKLSEYHTLQKQLSLSKKELDSLQQYYSKHKQYQSELQSLNSQLSQLQQELIEKQNRIKELQEMELIYDFWLKGFSDRGVKSYFFQTFLSELEHLLNIYSKKLMNTEVKFKVTETIIDILLPNGAGYEYLSTGQRKKVDLAFNFAIRKLFPDRNDWIVFDEVFDGLDYNGIKKVIDILSESTDRYTFIITHNSDLKEYFTQFIMIDGKGGVEIVG